MNRVRDKIAIVTGGALGLGAAWARMLAREQYEIKSDKTDHVAMHKGGALQKID